MNRPPHHNASFLEILCTIVVGAYFAISIISILFKFYC
jgi:hypothetical protein